MPATAQIELFKAGVITPTDVLEAQIARVEKYNGECNTFDDLASLRVSAALSKALKPNFRDGRFPDFRSAK